MSLRRLRILSSSSLAACACAAAGPLDEIWRNGGHTLPARMRSDGGGDGDIDIVAWRGECCVGIAARLRFPSIRPINAPALPVYRAIAAISALASTHVVWAWHTPSLLA